MEDEITQIGVFSCKFFFFVENCTNYICLIYNYKQFIISVIYSRGCDRGWPPVHARVTSYLDWIKSYSDVEIRP